MADLLDVKSSYLIRGPAGTDCCSLCTRRPSWPSRSVKNVSSSSSFRGRSRNHVDDSPHPSGGRVHARPCRGCVVPCPRPCFKLDPVLMVAAAPPPSVTSVPSPQCPCGLSMVVVVSVGFLFRLREALQLEPGA